MDNTNTKSIVTIDIEKISGLLEILISKYNNFFNIGEIFSSENGGKTRINRQVFNENHESIQATLLELNFCFEESLGNIRQQLRDVLVRNHQFEKADLTNLVFDDTNFLEILQMDIESKTLMVDSKSKLLTDVKELLFLKNKVFNFKYFLDMFDTTIFDKYINKLGVEDLINSTIIFEIIDSYALQFNKLQELKDQVNNLGNTNQKFLSLDSINDLLDLYKRRVDNYNYANVRYKIALDYNCNLDLNKSVYLNKAYLENIISCFIEQSCMDLVKKELKKGKIQKQIEINININKGILNISVKNNGFEVRNIYNLFTSDIDNRYPLEAKNLANMLNAKLDVISVDNEGMNYNLSLKLK